MTGQFRTSGVVKSFARYLFDRQPWVSLMSLRSHNAAWLIHCAVIIAFDHFFSNMDFPTPSQTLLIL
jgi:hypothetical protein